MHLGRLAGLDGDDVPQVVSPPKLLRQGVVDVVRSRDLDADQTGLPRLLEDPRDLEAIDAEFVRDLAFRLRFQEVKPGNGRGSHQLCRPQPGGVFGRQLTSST